MRAHAGSLLQTACEHVAWARFWLLHPPAYVLLHTVTRKASLHGTRATYSALTVQHPHMVGNTAASPLAWRPHEQCNAGLHATACSQEIASQDVHACMTFWSTPCACST
jgi:hypothetical protein